MSLGKLLASGRSLAGGPSVGRYNVSSRNRLPKFGSAKNPFAPGEARPVAEPARQPGSIPVDVPAPVAVEGPASSPFAPASPETPVRNAAQAAPTRLAAFRPAVVGWMRRGQAAGLDLLGRATAFARRLVGRVRGVRPRGPQPLFPRFGKPAVQGELSLDNVRVVRNDLLESDLEIVMSQTDTGTQVAPTVAAAKPNPGPVPTALKKMTNRVLGVKPG